MTTFLSRMLLLGIGILASNSNCFSQAHAKRIKVYKAIISTSIQTKKMRGVLQEVQDSSIIILSDDQRIRIPAISIQEVTIKRKGETGRGALTGGLVGLGVGLMVGFGSGDDQCDPSSFCLFALTAEEKALTAGLALGMSGAVIGTIIGSLRRAEKITTNGDQHIFQNNVKIMKRYARSPSGTP